MFHRAEIRPSTPRLNKLSLEQIRGYIWIFKEDLEGMASFFKISDANVRITILRQTGKSYGLHLLELYDVYQELRTFFQNISSQKKPSRVSLLRFICNTLHISTIAFNEYMSEKNYPWEDWCKEGLNIKKTTSPNTLNQEIETLSEKNLQFEDLNLELENFYNGEYPEDVLNEMCKPLFP